MNLEIYNFMLLASVRNTEKYILLPGYKALLHFECDSSNSNSMLPLYSHGQMFPFAWFHFEVHKIFHSKWNSISVKMTAMKWNPRLIWFQGISCKQLHLVIWDWPDTELKKIHLVRNEIWCNGNLRKSWIVEFDLKN